VANMMYNVFRRQILGNGEAVWIYPEPPESRWRRIIWRLLRRDRRVFVGWRDKDTGEPVTDNFTIDWDATGLFSVQLAPDTSDDEALA